ncbi:MAG: hypothetical protein LBQ74_13870 [Prevotella sp.]|jgi:hypothetical protein|nr:hypothetical protein [Prevotella sp.]
MDIQKIVDILTYHQQWRQGADIPQTDMKKLTEALDGAIKILSHLQHENRWRKVSEELPEVDDYLQYSVIDCLVKLDCGAYALAVYHTDGMWLESGTGYELEVTEWKPIN